MPAIAPVGIDPRHTGEELGALFRRGRAVRFVDRRWSRWPAMECPPRWLLECGRSTEWLRLITRGGADTKRPDSQGNGYCRAQPGSEVAPGQSKNPLIEQPSPRADWIGERGGNPTANGADHNTSCERTQILGCLNDRLTPAHAGDPASARTKVSRARSINLGHPDSD